MKTFPRALTISFLVMFSYASNAAPDGAAPSALGVRESVGAALQLSLGQGTNMFSAREVKWVDASGVDCRMYVIQERGSRETLAVNSTNNVFWLKDRLIAIERRVQSLSFITSEPLNPVGLTDAVAITVTHSTPRRKDVSLATLLKEERDKHLAGPLLVRSIQARVQGDQLIVEFESYTHLKGHVVLDGNLDVLSMELMGAQQQ